jgi:hypothetical protein
MGREPSLCLVVTGFSKGGVKRFGRHIIAASPGQLATDRLLVAPIDRVE